MRILSRLLILPLSVLIALGCTGGRSPQRSLLFQRPVESDTTDFITVQVSSQLLSFEVLGRSDSLFDGSYRVFFQIGVYGAPGFDIHRLALSPESVLVTANGVRSEHAHFQTFTQAKPWETLTTHWITFRKDSILNALGDSRVLPLEVRLGGYAQYNGLPVLIEPIRVLDPWFRPRVFDTGKTK
jgi:hypothetical protein